MSKKANPKLIGGFVVSALIILIGGILTFGSGDFFREKITYVMFFKGSVNGLDVGAPVAYRGVSIGAVTKISVRIEENSEPVIPVVIEIDPSKVEDPHASLGDAKYEGKILRQLVARGLRGQLELQSLITGKLFIQLTIFPSAEPAVVGQAEGYPTIPTIPSDLEKLKDTIGKLPLKEIANNTNEILQGIDRIVNSPEIPSILRNADEAVEELNNTIRQVQGKLVPMIDNLDGTIGDARMLVTNVNDYVGPLATGLDNTLGDARQLTLNINKRVEPLVASIEKTSTSAQELLLQATKAFKDVDRLLGRNSPAQYQFAETLEELRAAARSIRIFADYIEQHPDALIYGKRRQQGKE